MTAKTKRVPTHQEVVIYQEINVSSLLQKKRMKAKIWSLRAMAYIVDMENIKIGEVKDDTLELFFKLKSRSVKLLSNSNKYQLYIKAYAYGAATNAKCFENTFIRKQNLAESENIYTTKGK